MRKHRLLILCLLLVLSSAAMAGASSEMPEIYQGVTTLSTTGEKEWVVHEVGECGNWDDHYRKTLKESAEVQVPSVYIRAGVVADPDKPSITKASAEYKVYKNGQLIEYWNCAAQSVPPIHPMAPWASMIAVPMQNAYCLGLKLEIKGEHGVYDEGNKVWEKEQGEYIMHGFYIENLPLPASSHRLTGQKTEVFDGWISATLFWDWKPAADQDE